MRTPTVHRWPWSCSLSLPFVVRAEEPSDEAAIKQLVQQAYVDGLLNLGDLEQTRAGFHPDFVLLGLRNGQLTRFPIADWIASAEKQKAAGQNPPPTTIRKISVDITGTAAAVRLELDRAGKLVYTDYLSLYKFADGWKIVGKIYFSHS
ncbi:MAG: nuclear transport factor 2 family protein [Candidatus Moduliflexus flocculans]|nr:nuclear transport factor 2 family protein [Candidatus Moduliflexus flocculans]